MTPLLLKAFIKGDWKDNAVRGKCGTLAGIVGIICNLILFCIKFLAGSLSGSVSITADAFNNLSDMGSSIVTMLGFKIAAKPADPEHPFGHGRIEYISAALVAVLIMLVGFELLGESVDKFLNPSVPNTSLLPVVILTISIFVKLWLAFFNRKLSNLTESMALKATSQDCLNDCISTGAVLMVNVVCKLFPDILFIKYLDSVAGFAVALFILYSGFKSLKETMEPLIGLAPDSKTVEEIKRTVFSEPEFLGIHDLILHNYGPKRSFVSLHVEVSANGNILEIHEKIDLCERQIKENTGIDACIHMDPIVTDDEEVNTARLEMAKRIASLDKNISIHDFRMVKGENQNNLIFDVVIPADCKLNNHQIKAAISALATDLNPTYKCVITIDTDFSGGNY